MTKPMIGSRLRQLRRQHGQTQAEMAKALGVSASYINLLENNQRALSDQMLIALSDTYNVDWQGLMQNDGSGRLADLRGMLLDPLFSWNKPDLQELRDALHHSPLLVEQMLTLYRSYSAAIDEIGRLKNEVRPDDVAAHSPEQAIRGLFLRRSNYLDELEVAAEKMRATAPCEQDDIYAMLKARLKELHALEVRISTSETMGQGTRFYDEKSKIVHLSVALDLPNRIFQLAHVVCLIEHAEILAELTKSAGIESEAGITRCRAELANYFAAAVLMPYQPFLNTAERTRYDLDRLAAEFGASFEQVAQRLTTMQREGSSGIPFFFVRLDRAGNVTKRLNSTSSRLAELGGACSVWNVHETFDTPGKVLPQFLELPEGDRYISLTRTAERPVLSRDAGGHRLAIALGCELKYADQLCYAQSYDLRDDRLYSWIGISCHLCPRQSCARRAHGPLLTELPIDINRRGETRYES